MYAAPWNGEYEREEKVRKREREREREMRFCKLNIILRKVKERQVYCSVLKRYI
jgi:hypothetical protein